MIRKILDNIEIKIICLFLAIIMWLYANDRTDIISRIRAFVSGAEYGAVILREIPVELTNVRDNESFSIEPKRISVSVICSTNALIDISTIRVKIKLAEKDQKNILLNENNVILPDGLRFVNAEPREIKISNKPNSG